MSKSNCTKVHPGPCSVPKCGIGKFDPDNPEKLVTQVTQVTDDEDNPEKLVTQVTDDEDNPEKLVTQVTDDEDNPEKLVTQVTQDEEKDTNKNTTQYMFDTTMRILFCLYDVLFKLKLFHFSSYQGFFV